MSNFKQHEDGDIMTLTGETYYMIIDTSSLENTKVLKVATLRRGILWGELYKAQGKTCIGPPLLKRGFAKMDKTQLQYLYWNLSGITPPDDYLELVAKCKTLVEALPKDDASIEGLEREIQLLKPDASSYKPSGTASKVKSPADQSNTPRTGSTTGRVWEICDTLFVAAGNKLPDRKAIMDGCVAQGINLATAATQYSKWKKAKGI